MVEKFGIVWNPSKADGDALQDALNAAFRATLEGEEATPEVFWFETTPEDPGQGAASRALDAGCSVVIAAGGDGTVRAVAERLGESGAAAAELGIVPLGTGNLLARNLQIPLSSPQAALERALTRTATSLDLGTIEYTREDGAVIRSGFVVMVGFGIDAQMIVETDDELKAKAGWLAYVESLGRAAASTDVVDFSLTLDDRESIQEQAHTLLIANCGSIQGGITLLPDAVVDDGELDLLVLRADGVAAWVDTMRNMMWDNGLKRLITGRRSAESSHTTAHLRATQIRVALPVPLVIEIDGDEIGDSESGRVTEFTVTVQSALQVR